MAAAAEITSTSPNVGVISSTTTKNSQPGKAESKANPTYTSPLPPCKICGAKASGLHYGVNTCEACKGFFRRAIKFQKKYKCFRQQNCDILGGRSVRTSCPFCRLQKCLNMGMAHKAIKTGRYTHAKRTENIMEVKRLENVSKSLSSQPTSHHVLKSNSNNDLNFWKGESIDIKKEPDEDANYCYPYMTTTNAIDNTHHYQPNDQNSYCLMSSTSTFPHSNNQMSSAPYGKQNDLLQSFQSFFEDSASPNKSSFSLNHQSQSLDFVGIDNTYQPQNSYLTIPSMSESDGFISHTNPSQDGIRISIPTPPLSSSSLEDIAPYCPTSLSHLSEFIPFANSNEAASFILAEEELSRSDPMDLDSSQNTYTQLLPLQSSGPIPSPSSLSSSSMSSSPSSVCLESAESPPLANAIPYLMTPSSDSVSAVVNKIRTDTQNILSSLVQSHRKHVITLAEYDSNFISTVQQQFIDRHEAKAEMFGLTSPFVKDEVYSEIYRQTGLDVDGRHEMQLFAYRSLGTYLKSIINFAHIIPGFTSLCLEDQHSLLKVSNVEQWYLNAYLGINMKHSVILMPNLKVFSFSEFASLLGEEFACKCFEMAPAFQKLSLTYEMLVLWKVINLFSTDRPDLKEPEKVTQLQEAYLEVLSNLTEREKQKANPLSHIMSLTIKLRDIDSALPIIFDQDHILGIRAENLFQNQSSCS